MKKIIVSLLSLLLSIAPVFSATMLGLWKFDGTAGQNVLTISNSINPGVLTMTTSKSAAGAYPRYVASTPAAGVYDPVTTTTYSLATSLGVSAYAQGASTAATTQLDSSTGFTLQLWVNLPINANKGNVIVQRYGSFNGSNTGWRILSDSRGVVYAQFINSPTPVNLFVNSASLMDGAWHNLVLTFDSATKKGFFSIDGTAFGYTTPISGDLTGITSNGHAIVVGASIGSGNFSVLSYASSVLGAADLMSLVPMFSFAMPWNDTANNFISLASLNTPITNSSAIAVNADGHLATSAGRIRLWGTNLCFAANFPSHSDSETIAARLAKCGFNIVRIHNADNYDSSAGKGIWSSLTPDRLLDPNQLDKLDYLIYQLKSKGIYTNLNLLVARPFKSGTELDPSIDSITDTKIKGAIAIYDPAMIQLQKNFASALLTHPNPYTGYSYAGDPAVAFIEINNENGLMSSFKKGRFDNLPSYYATELNIAWNNWLKTRYVNQSALISEWVLAESYGGTLIVNGDFSSSSVSPWWLQYAGNPTALATVSLANEGPNSEPCAKIAISRPGQLDWHVQLLQDHVNLAVDQYYTITFQAKASVERTLRLSCAQGQSPYSNWGLNKTISLPTEWQSYSITFKATGSDSNARVALTGLGLVAGTVWLNHVALQPAGVLGSQALTNGAFISGVLSPWIYQLSGSPAAQGSSSIVNEGPNGEKCAKLTITSAGQYDWNAQLYQGNQRVESGKIYTITFQAKADMARTLSVACSMDRSPYTNLGLLQTVHLTADWQTFTVPFQATGTDDDVRICLGGLGLLTGTVWINNVQLQPGGLLGLYPDENLDTNPPTIRTIPRYYDIVHSRIAFSDWFQFLTETESNYWMGMRDYIKNTLHSNALIVGTIVGESTPNNMAKMDAIDSHNYWSHPVFPGVDWDTSSWYVTNTSMINSPSSCLPVRMAIRAVLNKPMITSEFSTPYPNTYEAESALLMAAYGGLQDFDAIYGFDYHTVASWANSSWETSYFDIDSNPVKLAASRAAALVFRRGDFAPALANSVIPLGADLENALQVQLPCSNPSGINASATGGDPKAGLISQMRLAVEGQATSSGTINATGPVYLSDTGELCWDTTLSNSGVVTGNTARTKMVAGFGGGKTYTLSSVIITPGASLQNGYSVIALSALDGTSVETATKLMVTALGCQRNSNSSYYIYPNTPTTFPPPYGANITLRANWGTSPIVVEGINSVITLPFAANRVSVWALDSSGNHTVPLPVTSVNGQTQITTKPSYQTIWYEIDIAPQ